ncbi:MAG TPA: GNAT family N-acetyltransferase [Micromonosporaceae bacterium]|nr:GNAT family N-acetyltransferase [Micromonosporaceae bacterium]HCU52557.1 GNAT family N-acetyltransferase [Micromonosporaceae bacterium]
MTFDDLPACTWSGSATHLKAVGVALDRAKVGVADYLVVGEEAVAVDYDVSPGSGTLWQLAVHPTLQSCGIGTILVRALEERIAARGMSRAELGVEHDNPRAKALYERLGYVAFTRRAEAWDAEAPNGEIIRYETVCDILFKEL